jgi:hypothetical protein
MVVCFNGLHGGVLSCVFGKESFYGNSASCVVLFGGLNWAVLQCSFILVTFRCFSYAQSSSRIELCYVVSSRFTLFSYFGMRCCFYLPGTAALCCL